MINEFIYEDKTLEVNSELGSEYTKATVGENKYKIAQLSLGRFVIEHNGLKTSVCCVIKDNKSYIDIDGFLLELIIPNEDSETAGGIGAGVGEKDKIYAPMPGKIVKLLVKEGDDVAKKQPMVIVEAMKMENQVNSQADGKVKKINFSDGDHVDTETPIIELEIES